MGNRANLVVVENGGWTLHYAHWAGCRMRDALAFGPEFAVLGLGLRTSMGRRAGHVVTL
jgi:hypothetical protein